MAWTPCYARPLLLLGLTAFLLADVANAQEQPSGYRIGRGERLDVTQSDRQPARVTASLSDDAPAQSIQEYEPSVAEENHLPAAQPQMEAEVLPESPAPAQTQPPYDPQPNHQPQYVPQHLPQHASPMSVASVGEHVAASAAHRPPASSDAEPLPLAPRSEKGERQLARPSVSQLGPVGTVITSLAIVLGLFAAVAWISRRLRPAGTAPLPKEAVELLGRTTVSGQHSLQLVRFGGRLLLVAFSPHGAATLTEVCDPAEVERLTAICLGQRPGSTSESFRQTIRELEREPAGRAFVDQRRPTTVAAGRTRSASRA